MICLFVSVYTQIYYTRSRDTITSNDYEHPITETVLYFMSFSSLKTLTDNGRTCLNLQYYCSYRIYNKILDRYWLSARLFVT